MRVFTTLPQARLGDVAAAAAQAESDGYDGVVTLDNRHEPFMPLAIAAVSTERIELATGIAVAFPRSPMVTAMQAWDLQTASNGRFVLGLGSQIKPHIERRFSTPWSAPAPRMREYVQALRAIWHAWATGERLSYEGEHYRFSLMTPNFTPEPLDGPPPAVTIAAVGPRMLAMAADEADGVRLHAFCTRRYLEQTVMPLLEERLAKRGRERSSFQISGGGFVCTGPDDQSVAEQVEWVRMRVGFYGSTPAYWPVLEAHDLGDLGRHLRELTRQGKWDELPSQISDDVVRLFAAVGRHDELVAAVEDRFGGVSDAIGASASPDRPGGLPPDLIADLQALPTLFVGFAGA
jgi:probable F420-dependent oxidoreductase